MHSEGTIGIADDVTVNIHTEEEYNVRSCVQQGPYAQSKPAVTSSFVSFTMLMEHIVIQRRLKYLTTWNTEQKVISKTFWECLYSICLCALLYCVKGH